jgi:hypothetical protein
MISKIKSDRTTQYLAKKTNKQTNEQRRQYEVPNSKRKIIETEAKTSKHMYMLAHTPGFGSGN